MEFLKVVLCIIRDIITFTVALVLHFLSYMFLFYFLIYSFYPHPDVSYLYLGLGSLLCYIFSKEIFSKIDEDLKKEYDKIKC